MKIKLDIPYCLVLPFSQSVASMDINMDMASFAGVSEPSNVHSMHALTAIEDRGSNGPSRAVRPLFFFQGEEARFQSFFSGLPEMVDKRRGTVVPSRAVTDVARIPLQDIQNLQPISVLGCPTHHK